MTKNCEFKILILPGELNGTPNGEDLILLVNQEEFMRMWQRGQEMLRSQGYINGHFKGSPAVSC